MQTLVVLFGGIFLISTFCIIKGLIKGRIKYGYKYYGKGITASKKEDPEAFWFGAILYSILAISSVVMFIIEVR